MSVISSQFTHTWHQARSYYAQVRDAGTVRRTKIVTSAFIAESERAAVELYSRVSTCTLESLHDTAAAWTDAGKKVVNDLLNFSKASLTAGDYVAHLFRGQVTPDMSCFTFNQQRRSHFWDLAARVAAFSLVIVCGVSAYNAAKSARSLGPALFNTLYFGPSFSRTFKTVAHTLSAYILATVSVESALLASDLIELAARLEGVDNPFDDSGTTIPRDVAVLEASEPVRQQLRQYVAAHHSIEPGAVTDTQVRAFVRAGLWEDRVRVLLPAGINWNNCLSTNPAVLTGNEEVMWVIRARTRAHFNTPATTMNIQTQVEMFIKSGEWANLVRSHITPNGEWYNKIARSPDQLKSNPAILRAIRRQIAAEQIYDTTTPADLDTIKQAIVGTQNARTPADVTKAQVIAHILGRVTQDQIEAVTEAQVDTFIDVRLWAGYARANFKHNVGRHDEARAAFVAFQDTVLSSCSLLRDRGNLNFLARVLHNIAPHIRLLGRQNAPFRQLLDNDALQIVRAQRLAETLLTATETLPSAFTGRVIARQTLEDLGDAGTQVVAATTGILNDPAAAVTWARGAVLAAMRVHPTIVGSFLETVAQILLEKVVGLTYDTSRFYPGTRKDRRHFKQWVGRMVTTVVTAECGWAILNGGLSLATGTCFAPVGYGMSMLVRSAVVIVGSHTLHTADVVSRRRGIVRDADGRIPEDTTDNTARALRALEQIAAKIDEWMQRAGDIATTLFYKCSQHNGVRRVARGCPADLVQIAAIDYRHAIYMVGLLIQFMAFMASFIV